MNNSSENIAKILALNGLTYKYQLRIYEKIISRMEVFINRNIKTKIRKEEIKFLKSSKKLNLNDIKDIYLEIKSTHEEVSIICAGLYISIYSIFESHLNSLCEIYSKHKYTNIELKDLDGKGIERARKYLLKVIGVNYKFLNEDWKYFSFFNKIRNKYAHNLENNEEINRLVSELKFEHLFHTYEELRSNKKKPNKNRITQNIPIDDIELALGLRREKIYLLKIDFLKEFLKKINYSS